MNDLIERLRAKPEHVRKTVAFSASAGFTGVIALLWAVSLGSSGALALSSGPAQEGELTSAFSESGRTSLLSAVSAITNPQQGQVTVVETRASSTVPAPRAEERTVIPF
jgi:hypothetical protein